LGVAVDGNAGQTQTNMAYLQIWLGQGHYFNLTLTITKSKVEKG
jgi:hypothetical protein